MFKQNHFNKNHKIKPMIFFLFIYFSFFFFIIKSIRQDLPRNIHGIGIWNDFAIHGETYKSRNDAENIRRNNRVDSINQGKRM